MKITKLSELKIVPLPLSEIRLPAKSIKEHPDRQLSQIIRSIESFGFNDPIAVDDQGEVIEGVGRFLAAQALKLKTIPAIRLTHLTLSQKRAYRIAHNKICLNTGFDLRALKEEFEALIKLDEGVLNAIGFEEAEIEDLLKIPLLPDLNQELTESLNKGKTITCPHCGGSVDV